MPIRPCRSISTSTEPEAQILAKFLRLGGPLAERRLHLGGLAVELPWRPQRQAALEVQGEVPTALEARAEPRGKDHSTLRVEAVIEPPDKPRHLRPPDSVRGPLPFEPLRATVCPLPPTVNHFRARRRPCVADDARPPRARRRQQRRHRSGPLPGLGTAWHEGPGAAGSDGARRSRVDGGSRSRVRSRPLGPRPRSIR